MLPLVHCKTIDPFSSTPSESQECYLRTGMLPYKHSSFFSAYARLCTAVLWSHNVHRRMIEIFILSGLSLSRPVDTKTNFNLNNIIATLSLRATIGTLQDNWPLFHYIIGISGILPYNRNVTLQTLELFSAYTRLYNAAASPASRLGSAGSLAIRHSFQSSHVSAMGYGALWRLITNEPQKKNLGVLTGWRC